MIDIIEDLCWDFYEYVKENQPAVRVETEKSWVSLVEARSDTYSVGCGEKLPSDVVSYAPRDMSDVVGPSIISQFISGASDFDVCIELQEKEVDIVEVCHAVDFNESWAQFKKDAHSLVRLRHSVYVLGRKHSRLRYLENVTFSCVNGHPSPKIETCKACGQLVKRYSEKRREKRMVPQYKDVADGSMQSTWNSWMSEYAGVLDPDWHQRLIKVRSPPMDAQRGPDFASN